MSDWRQRSKEAGGSERRQRGVQGERPAGGKVGGQGGRRVGSQGGRQGSSQRDGQGGRQRDGQGSSQRDGQGSRQRDLRGESQRGSQGDGAMFKFSYATLSDLIEASEGEHDALIVVLDHITDVGNFGAVVRSAEVVGATGIVIPKARSVSVNDAVFRTSAGAIEHLKVAREANIADSLKRLKKEGFWVGGASEHAAQDIWEAPLSGRVAVVMGAEDTGISRLVRESCDFEFKLPQRGRTQSLNIAQAATAIMYEWLRRIS